MDQRPDSSRREAALARAFLLYKRKQPDAALRILASMPRDADVDDLRARIAAEKSRAKGLQDNLRDLRYWFHLDSSFRRAVAYLLAAGSAVYGTFELVKATIYAAGNGIAAEITTKVEVGSRYNRHWVDYTRPIYYDLLYGATLVLVGLAAILFVRRVARGAAEWEGLDAPDLESNRSLGDWL